MGIFYYAVCIKGNKWCSTGEKMIEPLKVWGRETLGREPKYCCRVLAEVMNIDGPHHPLQGCAGWEDEERPKFVLANNIGNSEEVNFCPFCGEQIEFVHDLDVEVIEEEDTTPRILNNYHVVPSNNVT